jgi:hypothetical protein
MPLPGGLDTVVVTGAFLDPSGAPLAGNITFAPSAVVSDSTGHVVLDSPRFYWLAEGSFESEPLVATDNDLSPSGWLYALTIAVENTQPAVYEVAIPHDPSPVDISVLIAAAG